MAHILIADDEAAERKLVRSILSDAGHTVAEAPNGAEALTLLASQKYDLLITDMYMPIMEGTELISHCQTLHPGLPIVAISGGGTYGEGYSLAALDAAVSLGAAQKLYKPFVVDQLLGLVEGCLAGPLPPAAAPVD